MKYNVYSPENPFKYMKVGFDVVKTTKECSRACSDGFK